MSRDLLHTPFFIFDVESIGLYGEGFAVAGGVYIAGEAESEFCFACPPAAAEGEESDRKWVMKNCPAIETTHDFPDELREAFWREWKTAKAAHPGILMAGECVYPVEVKFITECVRQDGKIIYAPYPLHEISSFMLAAGMEPMDRHSRLFDEIPAHFPLADARLSARLLATALRRLALKNEN